MDNLKEVLETMGNVEELSNGYYYVNGYDAYYLVDKNADPSDLNLFVGYPSSKGNNGGGAVTDGAFNKIPSNNDGTCYWENMNKSDTSDLFDAYVLPKNSYRSSAGEKFTKNLGDAGISVTNATYYGYGTSDLNSFEDASRFHKSNPNIKMQVVVGDTKNISTQNASNCKNLDDNNVSIYCLSYDGSKSGERTASAISGAGFDNVYEINTDNNAPSYLNKDANSGLTAVLAGLVAPRSISKGSSNPNINGTNWGLFKYLKGSKIDTRISLGDVEDITTSYDNQLPTDGFVTLAYSTGKGVAADKNTSVKMYKRDIEDFMNSSALNTLTDDVNDAKSLQSLIRNFRDNHILRGDLWEKAYDKLDRFDKALSERIALMEELSSVFQEALSELMGCMTATDSRGNTVTYTSLDTTELPNLKIELGVLQYCKEAIEANIAAISQDDEDAAGAAEYWAGQLKIVEDSIVEVSCHIGALVTLEETYTRVMKKVNEVMTKVNSFNSNVEQIKATPKYEYKGGVLRSADDRYRGSAR